MFFRTSERDGHLELALDAEGIDYLEQGLTELRYLPPGEAVAAPALTDDGVSQFVLKRVSDAD